MEFLLFSVPAHGEFTPLYLATDHCDLAVSECPPSLPPVGTGGFLGALLSKVEH